MKIAKHFRAYLEDHQYLYIAGIGRFEIITDVIESSDHQTYSRRLLQFHPAGQPVSTDEPLVDYLSARMKSHPNVIHSDLEDFGVSTRELLIQGLEAEVPGIGFLNMGASNQLVFSNKSRYYSAKYAQKKLRVTALGISFWF